MRLLCLVVCLLVCTAGVSGFLTDGSTGTPQSRLDALEVMLAEETGAQRGFWSSVGARAVSRDMW